MVEYKDNKAVCLRSQLMPGITMDLFVGNAGNCLLDTSGKRQRGIRSPKEVQQQ